MWRRDWHKGHQQNSNFLVEIEHFGGKWKCIRAWPRQTLAHAIGMATIFAANLQINRLGLASLTMRV
jgi:hypothetical protein